MEPSPEQKGWEAPHWVEAAVGQPLWNELLAARPVCKATWRECRRKSDCPMVHKNALGVARNVGKVPHASFVDGTRRMFARPPLARLFQNIASNRNLRTIVQTPVTSLHLNSGQRHLLVLAGRSQGSAGHGVMRANLGYAPRSGGGSVTAGESNRPQSKIMLVALTESRALELLLGGGAEVAATTFPCGDVVRGCQITADRIDMLTAVGVETAREWFYQDGTGRDDLFLIATFNGLFTSDKSKTTLSIHGSEPIPTGVICRSGGYKHAAVDAVAVYALLVPPAWLEDTFPDELRALAYPPAYAAALRRACDKVNGRASALNDMGPQGIDAALAASSSAPSGVWATEEETDEPSPTPASPAGPPLPVGRAPPRSALVEQADSGRDGAGQQPRPESGRRPQSGAAPVPTRRRGVTEHASAGQGPMPRSRSPPSREAEWPTDEAEGPPWSRHHRAPRVPKSGAMDRRSAAVPPSQRGSSSHAGRRPYSGRGPYDSKEYM